jgi:hypothetical protein
MYRPLDYSDYLTLMEYIAILEARIAALETAAGLNQ